MNEVMEILGVKVSITNLPSACETISHWINSRAKTYVCITPVATIMECQKDKQYQAIVNNAGMATPDGMPLVWLGKMKGEKTIERTYGPDLMLSFCNLSEQKG